MNGLDQSGRNMSDIHLGEYIERHVLDRLGITQKELADRLNVSRQRVNQIIKGKGNLSADLALRMADVVGETPQFWLKLQKALEKGVHASRMELVRAESPNQVKNLWEARGPRTLVDHEIMMGNRVDLLGIEPFSEESVQPASYDLRLGNKAIVASDDGTQEINVETTPLVLLPEATAIVQSLERFEFPMYLLGRLGAISELAAQGILVTHGIHMDPGFKGLIFIALKNIGYQDVTLEYGKRFLSLEINYLSIMPAKPYEGEQKEREEFSPSEHETVNPSKNWEGTDHKVEEALGIITKFIKNKK